MSSFWLENIRDDILGDLQQASVIGWSENRKPVFSEYIFTLTCQKEVFRHPPPEVVDFRWGVPIDHIPLCYPAQNRPRSGPRGISWDLGVGCPTPHLHPPVELVLTPNFTCSCPYKAIYSRNRSTIPGRSDGPMGMSCPQIWKIWVLCVE